MKTLLCCLALTSFIRCSGPVGQQEPATAARDTSGVTGSSKGAKSARDHAEGILAGKIKPTDNDATMAWLDSLQSLNQSTRDYAFRVYKSLSLQSDGALGEAICGYIKDYFAAYPKEALVNYSKLNKVEKRKREGRLNVVA